MFSSDEESDDPLVIKSRLGSSKIAIQHGIRLVTGAGQTLDSSCQQKKVTSLADRSLHVFLQDTHITHFEIHIVQLCPRVLYPKLLAAALLQPTPRYFIIRLIIRHWPIHTLSLKDLGASYSPFALLFGDTTITGGDAATAKSKTFDSRRDEAWALATETLLNRVLVTILESFIASLGYANHRMRLKCLDFRLLPWIAEQNDILLKFLRKHEALIVDWASMEKKSHIKISMDLQSEDRSVNEFWTTLMKKCPGFIQAHSMFILSPLVTGETNTMRTVMKQVDKASLRSLTINGELMFNKGGGYETDVDHVRDIFNGLYKQELPQWMTKLKLFINLTELHLPYSSPVPQCEIEDSGIRPQVRELKRISPCALSNWIQVFSLLSPNLKHMTLRGQLVQGHLEQLLGKVPFCLTFLNLEDCGLNGADLAFLGRSRHRNSLKVLKIGDLNMGKKFAGLLQMIKGIKQLETLDLCLEGYDRYTSNVTLDDCQAIEIIHLIRQQYTPTLRYLNLSGGHVWSKAVLMKAITHLVPMPHLCGLSLPSDGLSQESVLVYEQYKTVSAGFKYKLEKCGPEFKEVQMAVLHYLRKGCRVTASLCREGIVIQVHQHHSRQKKLLLLDGKLHQNWEKLNEEDWKMRSRNLAEVIVGSSGRSLSAGGQRMNVPAVAPHAVRLSPGHKYRLQPDKMMAAVQGQTHINVQALHHQPRLSPGHKYKLQPDKMLLKR